MNHREITKRLGISFRQLDTWTTKGWIKAMNDGPGTGHAREWSTSEFIIIERMANLVKAGVKPYEAACIAHGNKTFLEPLRKAVEECVASAGMYSTEDV